MQSTTKGTHAKGQKTTKMAATASQVFQDGKVSTLDFVLEAPQNGQYDSLIGLRLNCMGWNMDC